MAVGGLGRGDIEASFVLEDKATAPLKKIEETAAKTGKTLERSGDKAGASWIKMASVIGLVVRAIRSSEEATKGIDFAFDQIGKSIDFVLRTIQEFWVMVGAVSREDMDAFRDLEGAVDRLRVKVELPKRQDLFDALDEALYGKGGKGGLLDGMKEFPKHMQGVEDALQSATRERTSIKQFQSVLAIIERMKTIAGVGDDQISPQEISAIEEAISALRNAVADSGEAMRDLRRDTAAAYEALLKFSSVQATDFFKVFEQAGEGVGDGMLDLGKKLERFGLTVEDMDRILADVEFDLSLDVLRKDLEMVNSEFGLTPKLIDAVIAKVKQLKDETKKASEFAVDVGNAVADVFNIALDGFILDLRSAEEVLRDILRHIARLFFSAASSMAGKAVTQLLSAKGNVFNAGEMVPFARGGVISSPVVFPMRRGVGIAGEAGPEAIMPLRRGRDGMLGVNANGAGGGSQITLNITAFDGPSIEAWWRRHEDRILAIVSQAAQTRRKFRMSLQ